MNFKHIGYFFLTLLLIYSCNDNNTDYTTTSPSKDAQIYSFSLEATHPKTGDSIPRAQDSIRFLELNKMKYAIDQLDLIIYNPDSLPFGIKLAKAKVKLSVNPTFGAGEVRVTTPDSTYVWNTTDSIDFSHQPVYIEVLSRAATTRKYKIDLRIHKIDPDLMVWQKMNSILVGSDAQKVVMCNDKNTGKDKFYNYSIKSGVVSLFTADKQANLIWASEMLSGLPSTVDIASINIFNDKFYAITTDGFSYASTDGKEWLRKDNGKELISILGVLPGTSVTNNALLVVFKGDGGRYYFGKTKDLQDIVLVNKISSSPFDYAVRSDFPKNGFASITEDSKNILVLVGGNDFNKNELSTTWLIRSIADGIEITPGTNNTFFKGVGLSAFFYDDKLYTLAGDKFYISDSWGQAWVEAPTKQSLDSNMKLKVARNLIRDTDNNMWVFEKESLNKMEIEVWKGRLNRLIPR